MIELNYFINYLWNNNWCRNKILNTKFLTSVQKLKKMEKNLKDEKFISKTKKDLLNYLNIIEQDKLKDKEHLEYEIQFFYKNKYIYNIDINSTNVILNQKDKIKNLDKNRPSLFNGVNYSSLKAGSCKKKWFSIKFWWDGIFW